MAENADKKKPAHMTVRLPEGIRGFAGRMHLRMREKEPLIESGEWAHWKQMPLADLILKYAQGQKELVEMGHKGAQVEPEQALMQAVDNANLGRFIALRIGRGDRVVGRN